MVGYLEVISKRHLLTGESDFSWEVPASRVKLRIAVRPSPDESPYRKVPQYLSASP